ncbi:MAG: dihydropteroate synthase [Eubacterium sp.]|nr:dihydropteroate synthase [Eubacterium sp.]
MYVMGILNVTPDSFSDGGRYNSIEQALKHTSQLIEDGADIIDIGGESTRPGFERVSAEEETHRVCRVIEAIKESFDIPISIDSYKASVVDEAIKCGADIANDVWGLRLDKETDKGYEGDEDKTYGEVVRAAGVPIILMHNSRPLPSGVDELGTDLLGEEYIERFISEMNDMVKRALDAGIEKDKIIVDPGIGFGKTQEQNLLIMKYLPRIVEKMDYPVLLGTSRKTMIGTALDLPVEEREEGTLVTTILAAEAGCSYVRVHDVKKNVRAIKMYEAIRG